MVYKIFFMKKLALIFLLLFNGILLVAQSRDALRTQLRAFYAASRMSEWEPIIQQLENEFKATGKIFWLEDLTWAEYGYVAYLLHTKQTEKASKVLSKALSHADELLKLQPRNGSYLALKSSLTAFRIQLRPILAPFLGPRSARLMEEALALDATHYRVLTEKGLARLYAPTWAGGNPTEAVLLFEQAAKKTIKNSEMLENDWYYLHLMASYGQSLQKTGRHTQAVEVYKQLLSVEPNFQWVKKELLPRAISDAKNQKSGT